MTEVTETDTSDDENTALLYRDRTWSEVQSPLQVQDGDFDWSEIRQKNGWYHAKLLGAADGICVDLYCRRAGAEPCRYRWLAEYNAPDLCKTIVIERWQDLIDFLAYVSSTMLVAVLPNDTAHVLEDLFDKTRHRVEMRSVRERAAQAKAPYKCNVPMCGDSGVCEECRKRGAK